MPHVSVFIPAYNSQRFLAQTLESVLAQTYQDWECVVVDDASTDGTAAIVESFVARDGRVRLHRVSPEEKTPFPDSRNRALRLVTGRWVASLDHDDLWDPDKLRLQVAALDSSRQAVWSYHGARLIAPDDSVLVPRCGGEPGYGLLAGLVTHDPIVHSAVIVRRDVLVELGGYDLALPAVDDWYNLLRLALRYGPEGFCCVPDVLCSYRKHTTNVSRDLLFIARQGRKLLRRFLLTDGVALRHPVLAMKMVDGQVERELEGQVAAGRRSSARGWALLSALARPDRGVALAAGLDAPAVVAPFRHGPRLPIIRR